ncbi:PREDICTED: probable G-protein coupled receptor 132 [Nanorana parkeri]|uniref:probable G-protein coupled receptor 132 n=1 Tax=Nanorana parkeri TaxID=125878 RepID=UPI000853F150|nr:PREDICTED: probable G-protein coupled receptor 132 [Nanorana parkeri]
MVNSSNNSIPESQCLPPYNDSKFFVIVMYSIVLVIGLPANILTFWLTFLQIYRKNVLAVYLFSLSLSEIMYLGTLPLWILYVQNGHVWQWGPLACKITGFIFFNNIYISILLLCCISVDRYLAVEYALESRGVRRQKIAIGVTITICSMVALVHAPVFMLSDGDQTGNQTTCFETLPVPSHIAHFYVARFIIGFLVPLLTLMYTNYIIQRRIKTSGSFTSFQKTKVKYLAVAIIIIFMICFAPYHLVLLTRGIAYFLKDDFCDFEEKIYTVYSIFLCLVTVNSVADPFIYVLVSENVRKDICKAMSVWRRQLSFNTKSDNSTYPQNHNSRDLPLDKDCSTHSGLHIIDTLQDRSYSH